VSQSSAAEVVDPFNATMADAQQQADVSGKKARKKAAGDGVPVRLPPPADAMDFEGSNIVPIGVAPGFYYLVDAGGNFRTLPARDMMKKETLLDLFGADDSWLAQRFGVTDEHGALVVKNWDRVGKAIMRACFLLGPYDPVSNPPRRTGIWADEKGAPLLHLGGRLVFADGRAQAAGIVVNVEVEGATERHVYVREPSVRRQPAKPCPGSDIDDLRRDIADLWVFRDGPAAAMLALGWCAVASLGAAVRWRPNLVVLGGTGTGKTSLIRVLQGLLPVHAYSNDTTKAGLEARVTDRPGPIIVDEAAQGDRSGAAALFDMMLPASGGEGSRGLRGSPDGRGRSFSVLGAVCYAAIHPPVLKPEHMGRFTEITLMPAGRDNKDAIEAIQARAHGLGAAMLGRVIDGFGRWDGNLRAMRAALVAAGATAREADQVGALLAGWWLLASDEVATDGEAAGLVREASAFIGGAAAQREDSAGRRAWVMLASTSITRAAGQVRVPVGDLVREALDYDAPGDPEGELRRIGLKPQELSADDAVKLLRDAWTDDEAKALGGLPLKVVWFARQHQELRRLFAGTEFAGEAWWRAMEQMPHAKRSMGNLRMGKAYSGRAFCVPLAVLDPEEPARPPAPPF
jgi:hypothetical protein